MSVCVDCGEGGRILEVGNVIKARTHRDYSHGK